MKTTLAFVLFACSAFAQSPAFIGFGGLPFVRHSLNLALQVNGAAHSNVLTWSYTQQAGTDPATGTYVQRAAPCTGTGCTGPGAFTTIATVLLPALTYTDTTPTAGQTWWYQVIMENSGGQSAPSNEVSATTPFLPPNASGTLSVVSK
jgi:hypothetical protein